MVVVNSRVIFYLQWRWNATKIKMKATKACCACFGYSLLVAMSDSTDVPSAIETGESFSTGK